MTRRVYFYFVATFLLGAIVGAVGAFLYGWYGGRWQRHVPPDKEQVIQRLTRDLALTDAQVAEVRKAFEEAGAKQKALADEVGPKFRALREERRERIRAILTPEQRAKFDEIVRRIDERRARRPPPPPR
jgi:Spy/CpxP family protein refolding chaperone